MGRPKKNVEKLEIKETKKKRIKKTEIPTVNDVLNELSNTVKELTNTVKELTNKVNKLEKQVKNIDEDLNTVCDDIYEETTCDECSKELDFHATDEDWDKIMKAFGFTPVTVHITRHWNF